VLDENGNMCYKKYYLWYIHVSGSFLCRVR